MTEELSVVADFADFGEQVFAFANREARIDFRRDRAQALQCTASFCAMELKEYLGRVDGGVRVAFAGREPEGRPYVHLVCAGRDNQGGGFSFVVKGPRQLVIAAEDRNGLVNGTYEFLRLQGFRWLEPGAAGECRLGDAKGIVFPERDRTFVPSFKYRAFYFEFPSQENEEFLLWMARNRMNVYGASFRDTAPAAQKLGLFLLTGGHILTPLLDPRNVAPSGRLFYDEHRDWYGTPSDPARATLDLATTTQFCCTNPGLMDYIAEELVFRLNHQWREADILEISGFDTWGSTCQCPGCSRFASDSDKYLNFMREIRIRLDQAFRKGAIPHRVMLNSWAYEGTATMSPPREPIPAEMADARDNNIAFVINRCYEHAIDDPACKTNARYFDSLRKWGEKSAELALWVGEYYGVSRHVDLPLVFAENLHRSMQAYHALGAKGITFMHVPIVNWGCTGTTQMLHAQLAWDIDSDWQEACREFLTLRYGRHADRAARIYREVEQASRPIAAWRSWRDSILEELLEGGDDLRQRHYRTDEEAVRDGYRIADVFRRAHDAAREMLADEQARSPRPSPAPGRPAVAPEQMAAPGADARIADNLALDMRRFHYAWQVMRMMALTAHHTLLAKQKDSEGMDAIRRRIDDLALDMRERFAPIGYRAYRRFFEIPDVLTRSLMRPVLDRIHRQFPPKPTD